jgi:hypothetical protein
VLLPITGSRRRPFPRGARLWSHAKAPLARSRRLGRPRALRAALLASSALLLAALPAAAQNATWNNPATVAGPVAGTFDFNANANWTPAAVPIVTAFFGVSSTPNLSFSAPSTTTGGWTFNAGASNYIFTNANSLTFNGFNGAGIVINGGSATITNNNVLRFVDASTAGSVTINNSRGVNINDVKTVTFTDISTAGSATINNNSTVSFRLNSTAGSATITNNDTLNFGDSSTAGSATITNNLRVNIVGTSTAGSATITNNRFLVFSGSSTGGTARLINGATATIDLSLIGFGNAPGGRKYRHDGGLDRGRGQHLARLD